MKMHRLDIFSLLLLNPIKDAIQMSQFLNDNIWIIYIFNYAKIHRLKVFLSIFEVIGTQYYI